MQPPVKRPASALGSPESLNAKRRKYLSEQEVALISELRVTREELTKKTNAILDMHENIRKKELEISECGQQIHKLKAWQEKSDLLAKMIEKRAKQLDELEKHVEDLSKKEAERCAGEIKRLNKELAAEKAKTEDVSELEKNVHRSKLERDCRLALHELSQLKDRVWIGEHTKKELESTTMWIKKLETVEDVYAETQSKLEDAQQTMQEWRNSVLSFFGKGEDIKNPIDAKLRFMVYQQEMLVKAASPQSLLAMEEKGRHDEATMAKLQARIQELTKALQRNSKIVEQERTKGKEAKKFQLTAECKIRSLRREIDMLTKVERVQDDLSGRALGSYFETQMC